MPRRARLLLPSVPLHLIQRGNNRSACFYAEEDYLFYLDNLKLQAEQHGCAVHAWCLMTNHVHLLVSPSKPESASLMMKGLGQRFVQYINRTYDRSGTLWEGRFRSCLLQEEDYVLACYRYIEMNPVRAGMVEHPPSIVGPATALMRMGYPQQSSRSIRSIPNLVKPPIYERVATVSSSGISLILVWLIKFGPQPMATTPWATPGLHRRSNRL